MKKIKDKWFIVLLILIVFSFVLRVFLNVNKNIVVEQFDIGIKNLTDEKFYDKILDEDDSVVTKNGQLDYIINLFKNNALPTGYNYQAFHPPFNFAVFALFLKLFNLFSIASSLKIALLKVVPLIYTIIFFVVMYKLLKELGYTKKRMIIPFLIILFVPYFFYISRLINNDFLLLIFSMLTILYLIKWDKTESYKDACLMALFWGLGCMTKTSILCLICPMGFEVVIHIYRKFINNKTNEIKKIIIQIILVLMISMPLILWYQIRGNVLFGMDLFPVVRAHESKDVASTEFVDRWLINSEFFDEKLESNASNVYSYALNSFILSEKFIDVLDLNFLLIIVKVMLSVSIIGVLIGMFKEKSDKIVLHISYFTWIISFVTFNMNFPSSCTMHSRYILFTMIIASIYFENFMYNLKNKVLKNIITILFGLFILLCMVIDCAVVFL